MSVYVFLGPTLPVRDAHRYLDAEYLGPAAQGDVLRLLPKRPRAIAIVDGRFEDVPAIWHKEILLAMEAGVHVFGAASMGALRAAELDALGMRGVGEIYRAYARGRIEDDDEVAVAHGPAEHGYRELSEAMVNIRDRCRAAANARVVSKRVADRYVAIAKGLFYPERRWARIFEEARTAGVRDRDRRAMATYVKQVTTPSLKARDTIALLRRVAAFVKRAPRPFKPRVRTERTKYLSRLLAEIALPSPNGTSPGTLDVHYEHPPLDGRARDLALLAVLAARESLHGGHRVEDDDARVAEERLRREHGLLSGAAMMRWLQDAGLSDEEFDAWMRDEALAYALRRRFAEAITARVPIEARRLRATALLDDAAGGRANHGSNADPDRNSPRGADVGNATTVDPLTPIVAPDAAAGASCSASKLTSDDW